ncbi:MAG: hypothetical protein BWY85_02253 [Firmicutes bacterium ADurb.Bin506]|nr:MAG: hypothetical protein BWY85_02253 [Firmicutes bacterium ADurb.Bin506]
MCGRGTRNTSLMAELTAPDSTVATPSEKPSDLLTHQYTMGTTEV